MKAVVTIILVIQLLVAALPISSPGTASVGAAFGDWMAGWANRVQLVIDRTKASSTLQDFPVLVHLSSSSGINSADVSFIFDALESDANRKKIAITAIDGTTQLYVEIEKWDTAKKHAWLWVKVPSISSTSDTILYLYYDKTQPDNDAMVGDTGSAPARNVWDSSFVAVWHLSQSGSGVPREFTDSTNRGHDGNGGGTYTTPLVVSALAGDGQLFDGISDYIEFPDNDDFSVTTTGELTISVWISPAVFNFKSSPGGYVNFMGKGDVGRYEWSFIFYNRDTNPRPQRMSFYVDNPQGGLGSGSYTQKPIDVGQWVNITIKVDSQRTHMFRDGVHVGSDYYVGPEAYVVIKPRNGPEPVRIGTRNMTDWFEGRIDEVRMSNVSRSDSWVATSYLSESDRLLHFGVPSAEKPVFDPIGDLSVEAGRLLSFAVSATDPYDRPLVYSATNMPEGATFDPSTRRFSWIPTSSQVGVYRDVQFEASYGSQTTSLGINLIVKDKSEPVDTGGSPGVLRKLTFALAVLGTPAIVIFLRRRHFFRLG